ncbi:MAG: PAS domain S-box protein, partial [Oscillochloris sp.]|nr:PAS domain S-box protein [Oscillochloris sp.]
MNRQPEQPVEHQFQPTTRGFIALDDPARFAALIAETSPNLIYVYDLIENVTLYTNRRIQTLLGYTPADLAAMGPGLLFYVLRAEDVVEVQRHFEQLRSTADGEVREYSYHVRHKDGTWRWVRSHEMVIQRDAYGAVTQVLGIAEDVTARTGPEAELRWQADLLEHAQEAVIAWNLDGTITFWNLGAERMYGYRSAEAAGRLHQAILRGRAQPDHATIMADLLRTGSWAGDLIRYARDGRQLVISSHMILISGLAGQRQVLETNRDFTTRNEAELALQASEERWRNLIASIDQGFCMLEMLYGPDARPFDYRFLEVNPAFERHSGLRDATGKTARQLVPELEHIWLDPFARVIETGEPLRFEQRSAQLGRWFEIDAVRVGGRDSHRAALLFTDITARKQADADARFLSEVSEQIRVAVDPDELLATTAQMLGHHLGFWRCSFITIDVGVERWTIHRDYRESPTLPSLAGTYSLAHYPPELIAELRSGRVITIQDSASEPLTADFYQRGFRPLGIEAALGVPLLQDGRWVSAFLAGANAPRTWPCREIALVETVVERTWNAVVQKRSEQAIRRAHERLSLALERLDGFVYEYDVRTGQTERSVGNARVLGYEPDALTQQRVW